jgi:hypothetical protein
MNMDAVGRISLAVACLISIACREGVVLKEMPFRIIATDTGFDAPKSVPAGLRHIVFENRGSEIHEAMLVKLAEGMTPEDSKAPFGKSDPRFTSATLRSGPDIAW